VKQYLASKDIEATTELLTGDPAAEIVAYSHEVPVDLIILSSHGRSGLSGWSVSSVVQKVIHRANTSFMIIRAYKSQEEKPRVMTYKTLLVPLDGSRRAEYVFPCVRKLAQTSEAVPLLVRVVQRPEMPRRTPLSPEDAALADKLVARNQEEAAQYLADLKAQFEFGVKTRVIVTEDLIVALHELAEESASDLVVVSAHGYTGGTSRPYGSVTTSFITYGNSPLLVVQDLPQEEIEASEAEKIAAQAVRTSRSAGGRAVVNAE
jgi:nucleotide-binding universal stress UspA family protein